MSVINQVIADGILTLSINRPKALNALNEEVMSQLELLFVKGGIDTTNLIGVIITGEGEKAFVAGADIKGFKGLNSEKASVLSGYGQQIFGAIENFEIPVLAAINGFALGGGLELALACHIRLASTNARLGLPEVTLGIIPGYGGTQRLPHLIGKGRAMRMILGGDMINAETALQYGLISDVLPSEDLLPEAIKLVKSIGSKGPLAIAKSIQAVLAAFDPAISGMSEESSLFGALAQTEDFNEGVDAFIEKRKANFKGH